jgi:hypothetical protein
MTPALEKYVAAEQDPGLALDSLGNSLAMSNAVLVIGPQALTISLPGVDGEPQELGFYRLVAERLLARFDLPLEGLNAAGPSGASWASWDLHRACAQVMSARGISAKRLKPTVANLIRDLSAQVQPSGALAALAQLNCFDLIVCLTPDDLLARAIAAAQPELTLDIASYSPTAPSTQSVDIGAARPDVLRLSHPFGSLAAGGDFAIHEEDTLEYLHRIYDQGERRLKTLLTELRSKDRIFIGTSLPDWLGRGLMRFVNDQRLATEERTMEFLGSVDDDPALADFIARFSTNSIALPWAPDRFVAEIAALAAHLPPRVKPGTRSSVGLAQGQGHGAGPSVFISYASEDAAAARRLADTLRQLGFGEVWLDRKQLKTGDSWSDSISEAIAACDYFLPVLSARADARDEGVFWDEWRQALERARRVKRAFILPIGIDESPPTPRLYPAIFSGDTRAFNELHLLHAPAGQLGDDARDQLGQRAEANVGARRG